MNSHTLGHILALSTAVAWAGAVVLFRNSSQVVSPFSMNLIKNVIGTSLLFLTMFLIGSNNHASMQDSIVIIISGVIGIGIADTLFFKSLKLVGAGWSAAVECFYSPAVILFAFVLLGEKLSTAQLFGGLLIISSFFIPLLSSPERLSISKKELTHGFMYGILAMLLMGASITYVKPLLEKYSIIWSSSFRMLGGTLSLVIFGALTRVNELKRSPHVLLDNWKILVPASFLGGYLSLMLWIGGFKYAPANVASLLNQGSTFFTVLFASLFLKETLTRPKVATLILALSGCLVVILNS